MSEKKLLTRREVEIIASETRTIGLSGRVSIDPQYLAALCRDLTATRDALAVAKELCEQSLADLESEGWDDKCEAGVFWKEKLAVFSAQLPEGWQDE